MRREFPASATAEHTQGLPPKAQEMTKALREVGAQLDEMERGKKEWKTGGLADELRKIHMQRRKVLA